MLVLQQVEVPTGRLSIPPRSTVMAAGERIADVDGNIRPRPMPAPTGMLARLLGIWERRDAVAKDGRAAISRRTMRAGGTVARTVLTLEGTDTVSSEMHLETVLVSWDTLWRNAVPQRIGHGRTVVVQGDQLTLFKVEIPMVPDQVYQKVASIMPDRCWRQGSSMSCDGGDA